MLFFRRAHYDIHYLLFIKFVNTRKRGYPFTSYNVYNQYRSNATKLAVPKTTITGMGGSQFLQKFLIRICFYFWCFVFMQIVFYHSTPPSGLNFKHLLPI
uniref:Uncharacterized protein n=1 Tax=Kuenenia stuttgartiensis TaxID=174633 RepID=Q1Q0W7_KUEST|nr:unknown protein [Candidatus Kuenenia stuttgartiensis]